MPSLALTSGRKFSTTTSAFSPSRLKTSMPSGFFRFSVIARLLRCKFWKSEPWRGPPSCSPPSSRSASILMTLAPQSASCRTQVGPARTRVRSSTVKRARACEARGKDIFQKTPTGQRADAGIGDRFLIDNAVWLLAERIWHSQRACRELANANAKSENSTRVLYLRWSFDQADGIASQTEGA